MQTKVKLDDLSNSEHFVKRHTREVSEILNDVRDEDIDLVEMLTLPEHVEIPEGGATPELSTKIRKLIQECQLPFTLDDDLDGCYGDAEGSSNVTTIFEKTKMSIREAIKILDMTGQLDKALDLIEKRREETDPSAEVILRYAIMTLSKGWRAEKFLNQQDRWTTGSVSQDQGGLDLYDRELDCWVQLKPATAAASNGPGKYQNKEHKHLFYFWNSRGELVVTDAENYLQPKKEESDRTGIPGSLMIASKKLAFNRDALGRSFRYLWW